jgi:hypothetical protein
MSAALTASMYFGHFTEMEIARSGVAENDRV